MYTNPINFIPRPSSLLPSVTIPVVPPIPIWLFKYLTAFPFTGFFGLDHFALGSPYSGMAKILVNICTLGSWYAYDIVQVYNIANLNGKGLEIPFLESGSIGKGRLDDETMSTMSKNTQIWLYVLFICLFGGIYFITSFYVSESSDIISTIVRYVSKGCFWGAIILGVYTLFYYFMGKSTSMFNSILPTNQASAISGLFSQAGMTNPLTATTLPSSGVESILKGIPGAGTFFGGGNVDEIKTIARSILQDGGAKKEVQSYGHIYFALALGLLPVAGFLVYFLRKKNENKKNEVSNHTD